MPPHLVMLTLARVWPVLEGAGAPIAIAGGIALSYWGNPRSTQDVDLAVNTRDEASIATLLRDAGFQPTGKPIKDLGLFQLSQWTFEPEDEYITVELDLMIGDSDYYSQLASRAKRIELHGVPCPVNVLSREDLILHKLYAGRMIDLADVANLLEHHWSQLEQDYLHSWSVKLSIEDPWRDAKDRYHSSLD